MAAKKHSKKTPAKRSTKWTPTAADLRFHGLTKAQLESIDKKLVNAGKKPLSLLIKVLDKTEKSVPNLREIIEKAVKQYG